MQMDCGQNNGMKKISVITVCLNSMSTIGRTVSSVMNQDFRDLEYIIIDGGSSDGTVEFLKGLPKEKVKWISEPDNGIYEAMNKGVRLSNGEFCLFLNAGDKLVNGHVLSKTVPELSDADIILGNEILVNGQGVMCGFTPSANGFSLDRLVSGSVCHQATFIRRSLLIDTPYDESLRLVSDWAWIIRQAISSKAVFKTVDIDICFFYSGGLTDRNRKLGAEERDKVLKELAPSIQGITPYKQSPVRRMINHIKLISRRSRYSL